VSKSKKGKRAPTPLEVAERCVELKWPGRPWSSEVERWRAVRDFQRKIDDIDFRRHFPNRRYGASEAESRARVGNLDALWELLSVQAPELLTYPESWLWRRYRKAFEAGEWKFVNHVIYGIATYACRHKAAAAAAERHEKYRVPESRSDFLVWFLVNEDALQSLTAEQILDRWEQKRKELFRQGAHELPTFHGENRVQNFRRWLSRQGFKLGQRGKKHRREHVT